MNDHAAFWVGLCLVGNIVMGMAILLELMALHDSILRLPWLAP